MIYNTEEEYSAIFMRWIIGLLFLFLQSLWANLPPYKISLLGLEDKIVLRQINAISDLVKLRKKPPPSINALRYRIETDTPEIIKVLHANGYYDAYLTSDIEEERGSLMVYIFIHPGPKYTLNAYNLLTPDCKEIQPLKDEKVTLEKIGIVEDAPVYAENILASRSTILRVLAERGYPLASIEEEHFLANVATKTLDVDLCVDKGPKCTFGPLVIEGLKKVDLAFVLNKIMWKEGQTYTESEVEQTQENLIATDLFSSVLISHEEKPLPNGALPMKMRLTELKPRSISLGVTYATSNGPGATFRWTNRNFLGKGQQLSLDGFIEKIYSQGSLIYRIPDFLRIDQDWLWKGQLARENITVYTSLNYLLLTQLERSWGRNFLTYGIKGEYLIVHESIQNEHAPLFGVPFFWRYARVKNILDPLEGFIGSYKATYYHKFQNSSSDFYKNTLWLSGYVPFSSDKKAILALRMQFGSIIGASLKRIPLPKRFFGGSDNDLRGFKFKTVSPLNAEQNPTGGRAYIFSSCELRFRFNKSLGCIGFADFGTVTNTTYPTFNQQWFYSAGLGLRYFTFFGPLRLDVGFPINPRYLDGKRFDPVYRIYVSIGQTF